MRPRDWRWRVSETERGTISDRWTLARTGARSIKQSPDGLFVLATDSLKTGDRAGGGGTGQPTGRGLPMCRQRWSITFALLLVKGGAVAEGIDVLERREAGRPAVLRACFQSRRRVLCSGGDPARALAAYDVALALQPDAVPALRQAAATAERQNELERSLSYWVRLRKLEPDDPAILLGFGRVCLKMDLLEDAEPALARAAEPEARRSRRTDTRWPPRRSASASSRRRRACSSAGREAAAGSAAAIRAGLGLYIQGRLPDAAEHLGRERPSAAGANWRPITTSRWSPEIREGCRGDRDAREAVLRRYPDHAPSCEALGGLLMNAQRYDEAETQLRKAVRAQSRIGEGELSARAAAGANGEEGRGGQTARAGKSLRKEDEATSRLQLRLLEPER